MKTYHLKNIVFASVITFTGFVAFDGRAEDPVAGPASPAAQTAGEATFQAFHNIVDGSFVEKHALIPKPKEAAAVIIDSRPVRKFEEGHLVTAINIPESSFDEMTNKLPENKDTQLIFYCGGLKCPLSHKSATAAEKLGYKNVAVYAAGYPDWISRNHAPEITTAFVQSVVEKKIVGTIVDSRPARKFGEGHIPSAINLSESDFDEKAATLLPADKASLIIFYCNGYECPLSYKSGEKAVALGYKNAKLYQAGWPAWKEAMGTGK